MQEEKQGLVQCERWRDMKYFGQSNLKSKKAAVNVKSQTTLKLVRLKMMWRKSFMFSSKDAHPKIFSIDAIFNQWLSDQTKIFNQSTSLKHFLAREKHC